MLLISYTLSFDWRWPLLHALFFSCVMPCVTFDAASRKRAETDVGMRCSEGVNVKRCFYLMIIHLKDWLTCQTAEGGLISSLMFRPPTRNSFFFWPFRNSWCCFGSVLSVALFICFDVSRPSLIEQRISKRLVSLWMKNILMCVLQRIFKTHTQYYD